LNKLLDYLLTFPQYLLPQHFLTGLVYRITRIETFWFKQLLIKTFISIFRVNMEEAKQENIENYVSFNDFFTRELKTDARNWQVNNQHILSPVDGAVSQLGSIDKHSIIQAKGKDYSLMQLFAGDTDLVSTFENGQFATLYLSPRDYHRIHMPYSGRLIKSIYIPGDLFAVNNPAVRTVDGVFARNERFISIFESDIGKFAMIMVGALFVGSMSTVWAGQITPSKHRHLAANEYLKDEEIQLNQSDEFGLFNMGSTVILLFQQDKIKWEDNFSAHSKIQCANHLGSLSIKN